MLVCITESCEKKKKSKIHQCSSVFIFFFSSPLLEDGYLTKETGAKIGRLLFFFLLLLFFFLHLRRLLCFFFSIFLFSFGSLVHKRSGSEDVQTRALVFTSVSFFVCLFVNVLPLQTEVVREKNENSQCGKTH